MISCVDFIPAYSILFDYIDEKEGYEGVLEYWQYISDHYVEQSLGKCVKKDGLYGCWEYWAPALNEEAADFTMTYEPEKGYFEIDMHHCPSKGRLLDLTHMKPYDKYCNHCELLYKPVLNRYGLDYEYDMSRVGCAKCRAIVRERKK